MSRMSPRLPCCFASEDNVSAAADLNTPFAVAVDASTEDIYIADTSNNKVRVVTGFAVPTTTAGGPVAPAPPTPPRHHPHH